MIGCFQGSAWHLPSVFTTQVPIVTTPHFISSCLFLLLNFNLRNTNATEGSIIFFKIKLISLFPFRYNLVTLRSITVCLTRLLMRIGKTKVRKMQPELHLRVSFSGTIESKLRREIKRQAKLPWCFRSTEKASSDPYSDFIFYYADCSFFSTARLQLPHLLAAEHGRCRATGVIRHTAENEI